MSAQTAVVPQSPSLLSKMAHKFGVEPNKMMSTLKATAFRQREGEVSNEQMMALLIVADQYSLNPWTKEIYAFPDKNNGIVPVVGIDGWSRIINRHPDFDGMDFQLAETEKETSITCTIHRKDRAHPISVTEYLTECKRPTQPWSSHPKRMLRHKAMAQAARVAFGYVGIFDEDEAERIIEGQSVTVPEQRPAIEAINEALAKQDGDIDKITEAPPMTPAVWFDKLQQIEDADDLAAHQSLIPGYQEADQGEMRKAAEDRIAELTK